MPDTHRHLPVGAAGCFSPQPRNFPEENMGEKKVTYSSIKIGDTVHGRKIIDVDTATRGGSSATRVQYEDGRWGTWMASGASIVISR